jgi:xanthine dehydrogenase accessory factor
VTDNRDRTPLTVFEVARHILAAAERGEELVSVLATAGAFAGARVVVAKSGAIEGTLGSVELDAAALECAREVFDARDTMLRADLFMELHVPAEQLLIFGAGHIAVPLADLGVKLGFEVMVLDDRTEFATVERFPPDVRVRILDLSAPLVGLAVGPTSYVVLVTRAHKYDFDLLGALLQNDVQPRYIGMIGSRRRVRAAFTALLASGVPRERLERIRAPVGLDIGAETPAEIAVSIAAEITAVRRGGSAETLATEERVLDRFFAEPAT